MSEPRLPSRCLRRITSTCVLLGVGLLSSCQPTEHSPLFGEVASLTGPEMQALRERRPRGPRDASPEHPSDGPTPAPRGPGDIVEPPGASGAEPVRPGTDGEGDASASAAVPGRPSIRSEPVSEPVSGGAAAVRAERVSQEASVDAGQQLRSSPPAGQGASGAGGQSGAPRGGSPKNGTAHSGGSESAELVAMAQRCTLPLSQAQLQALGAIAADSSAYRTALTCLSRHHRQQRDLSALQGSLDALFKADPGARNDPDLLVERAEIALVGRAPDEALRYAEQAEQARSRQGSSQGFQQSARVLEMKARAYRLRFDERGTPEDLQRAQRCWEEYRKLVAGKDARLEAAAGKALRDIDIIRRQIE